MKSSKFLPYVSEPRLGEVKVDRPLAVATHSVVIAVGSCHAAELEGQPLVREHEANRPLHFLVFGQRVELCCDRIALLNPHF